MSYSDFLRRDMRLVILRILSELPGYRGNSSIIANLLDQLGHSWTRDQVKAELRWLADVGTLTLDEAGSVLVATLAERGQDAAEGRVTIDGIAKPRA